MAGIDPATEIPPLGLLPSRQRWRPPFTYTPADIDALMRQARESIGSPLLAETFETLIGFLAVTGMFSGGPACWRGSGASRLCSSEADSGDVIVRNTCGASRLAECHLR